MLLETLLASAEANISGWEIASNLGTIAAGVAAAAALIGDIVVRLYSKQPSIAIYISTEGTEQNPSFALIIQNLGTAPAKIKSICTHPSWKEIGQDAYAYPLELARDHTLLPSQSLNIQIDAFSLSKLLAEFYKPSTCRKHAFQLLVNLTYTYHALWPRKSEVTIEADLNLTSAYMSLLPLSNIIEDDETARQFIQELTKFRTYGR